MFWSLPGSLGRPSVADTYLLLSPCPCRPCPHTSLACLPLVRMLPIPPQLTFYDPVRSTFEYSGRYTCPGAMGPPLCLAELAREEGAGPGGLPGPPRLVWGDTGGWGRGRGVGMPWSMCSGCLAPLLFRSCAWMPWCSLHRPAPPSSQTLQRAR